MGQFPAKICNSLRSEEPRILVAGVKGAGKTTLLENLTFGEQEPPQNIQLGMQTIRYKKVKFTSLDLDSIPANAEYEGLYHGYQGIIFILDLQDFKKMDYVARHFKKLLEQPELKNLPILVFGNKYDLDAKVMNLKEVSRKLELPEIKDRQHYIHGLCALTREGLTDAMFWLFHSMKLID